MNTKVERLPRADAFLFGARYSLRMPIALLGLFSSACLALAAYLHFGHDVNFLLSNKGAAFITRGDVFAWLLQPYAGGVVGMLGKAALLFAIALILGGSWFAHMWRYNYLQPASWARFFYNGFTVLYLVGAYSLYAVVSDHFIWFDLFLLLPATLVSLYAVHGVLLRTGVTEKHLSHSSGRGNAQSRKNSDAVDALRYEAVPSTVNFDQIVGMQELKDRLLSAGQEIRSSKAGARNGILLSGEPGNGKTLFAEALAGQLKLPIISASFGDVASKWINQTTEQVKQMFADAHRQAPCVLFIDEIDSLIMSRDGQPSTSEESPRITNTILTEVVKLRGSGIVLVAATNFLERLDAAAIREGRFDFKVEVGAPDQAAREAIISRAFRKAAPDAFIQQDALSRVAKRWSGFSAARMDAVGKEVAARAKSKSEVTFDDLMVAMRSIQGRLGKLPDSAMALEDLSLTEALRSPLTSLALRMKNIVSIEEMGGTVPRGVLFSGPAGTGKTLTAQALAKSSGWGFLTAAGTDLIRNPEKIEKLFRDAADIRPCLIFLDESDELLQNREHSPYAAVTNKFLSVMDGAGGKTPDVMIVAATNFPERLDPATLRGGRFTEKVVFDVADQRQASLLATSWIQSLKLPTEPLLTQPALVTLLVGHSPANIKSALQLAVDNVAARALSGASKTIKLKDVEDALGVVS